MAEALGSKQRRFSWAVANLIIEMKRLGYDCSFGEVKRSDEQAEINAIGEHGRFEVSGLINYRFPVLANALTNNGKNNGVRKSVHQLSLAVDLNLFKDGVFLSLSEDHKRFGEFWESLGPDHRWGGRWGDGNHYSIEHEGVK